MTNPNLEILEAAVELLGELSDRLVFLGGCATGLLLTDVAAPPIRATQDVDVITEVGTMVEYYQLAERLRAGGFYEDTSEDAPICRWKADGLLLDVMPTNPQLLGFGSVWYQEARGGNAPDSAIRETHPHDHGPLFSGMQAGSLQKPW